jgi:hypothetical protein
MSHRPYRADGTPHRQPSLLRRWWCFLTGGHTCKYSANPSGSCIDCGWLPEVNR